MTELYVKEVSKSFGNKNVLEDITFKLSNNKIYGLLGRNGVGKSTLLNCICDRTLIKQGGIYINNNKIHENKNILHKLYLMNDDNTMYYGWEKITDLYKYTDIAYGNFDYKKAHRLAKKFNINENQKFTSLSTGLRTAVKLILAFCVDTDIVFLDEPTLGLDASLRNVFYQEIIKTYNQRPRIFLLATHLINEIQDLIEEAIILNNNRIILKDTVENIQQMVLQIKGPENEVKNIIGNGRMFNTSNLGQELITYVKANQISDVTIPSTIDVQPVDLQTAFIVLTEPNK